MQSEKFGIVPETQRHPYYIFAPGYDRKSAGVRALHLICHWLNRKGYPAFLVHIARPGTGVEVHPDLITPVLTQRLIDKHYEAGRTPVAVYPEVVRGNPLGADCVARLVLNYPGLLDGDKTYAPGELLFAYTQRFADSVPGVSGLLFVPVIDTSTFRPAVEPITRKGACFYAAKYKHAGNKVFGLPPEAIEIHRTPPLAQTANEIAELFRRSELFYCFEDTALVLEAALCGCPTVLMRSHYLQEPAGSAEFGYHGIALDDSPEQIAQAKETLSKVPELYAATVQKFLTQLDNFIMITQTNASEKQAPAKVAFELRTPGEKVAKRALTRRFLSVAEEKGVVRGALAALADLGNMTPAIRIKARDISDGESKPRKKYLRLSTCLNEEPRERSLHPRHLVRLIANARIVRVYRM